MFRENHGKLEKMIGYKVWVRSSASRKIYSATFKSFQIIRQGLVSVSFKNSYVVWTKPTPVGAAILDLSKLSLYEFHYEEMIPRYWSGQLKVAYKDTDCLLYLIETPDLYKIWRLSNTCLIFQITHKITFCTIVNL